MILHLQCNRTVALDAFFKQIVQDPVKISWIGSGCSVATEPTAEISHYYNITQVIQQWNHLQGWKSSLPLIHLHSPYPVFLRIFICWASWSPAVPLLLSDVSHRGWNCRRVFCCYQAVWVEEGGLHWTRWKLVYRGELMWWCEYLSLSANFLGKIHLTDNEAHHAVLTGMLSD